MTGISHFMFPKIAVCLFHPVKLSSGVLRRRLSRQQGVEVKEVSRLDIEIVWPWIMESTLFIEFA